MENQTKENQKEGEPTIYSENHAQGEPNRRRTKQTENQTDGEPNRRKTKQKENHPEGELYTGRGRTIQRENKTEGESYTGRTIDRGDRSGELTVHSENHTQRKAYIYIQGDPDVGELDRRITKTEGEP
jgi:hypothetical protein